jgi:hypothetical protein
VMQLETEPLIFQLNDPILLNTGLFIPATGLLAIDPNPLIRLSMLPYVHLARPSPLWNDPDPRFTSMSSLRS